MTLSYWELGVQLRSRGLGPCQEPPPKAISFNGWELKNYHANVPISFDHSQVFGTNSEDRVASLLRFWTVETFNDVAETSRTTQNDLSLTVALSNRIFTYLDSILKCHIKTVTIGRNFALIDDGKESYGLKARSELRKMQ